MVGEVILFLMVAVHFVLASVGIIKQQKNTVVTPFTTSALRKGERYNLMHLEVRHRINHRS